MRRKKARTRYYILYIREGQYLYKPAEDIQDAQEELNYLIGLQSKGITPLGIYDPQDWSFDWALAESLQETHQNAVNTLSEELRKKWNK